MGGSFAGFVARRVISSIAVVVIVAAITFVVLHVLRPEAFADTRPLHVELGDYLWRAFVHFDLGNSSQNQLGRRPVTGLIVRGLPGDLSLLLGGLVIGVAAGMAAGAFCAVRPGSLAARALQGAGLLALCAPVYWVGLVAIFFFAPGIGFLGLPFFPLPGTYRPITEDPLSWLHGLFVPWLILAGPLAAMCLRMMRASAGEVLQEDFVRTGVAKGLAPRTVVRRHVFPAAGAPVATLVGANMAAIVTNLLLLEQIFDVPGVFRLTTRAMTAGDFPLLQGMVIVAAAMVVVASFAADCVLAWLDPRVRT